MRYWTTIIEKGSMFGGPSQVVGPFIVGSLSEEFPDLDAFLSSLARGEKPDMRFDHHTDLPVDIVFEVPRIEQAIFTNDDMSAWEATDGTEGYVDVPEVESEV